MFCREVQRQADLASIPIVVVSSDAASEAACAPCRPAAFLAKPFSPITLRDTIAAILASRPSAGELTCAVAGRCDSGSSLTVPRWPGSPPDSLHLLITAAVRVPGPPYAATT